MSAAPRRSDAERPGVNRERGHVMGADTDDMRLSALVELREDLALISGRNRMFDNE